MVQADAPGSEAPWSAPLAQALEQLPAERRRQLRSWQPVPEAGLRNCDHGEQPLLDLASNDYLGLACHPALIEAASRCMASEGVGAGASRLVSGNRPVHEQLEAALAQWLGRARVLLFPSGFQANLAAVQALADRRTLVLADRLIHHSLLVGVQASGARLQRFAHNNLTDLQRRLEHARRDAPQRRLLVISESLFSMEGTSPDLVALSTLCQRHNAALLLDEAHALGVLGPGGRGLGHGVEGVSLISGTFGKAFGSGGAFLAGDALVGNGCCSTPAPSATPRPWPRPWLPRRWQPWSRSSSIPAVEPLCWSEPSDGAIGWRLPAGRGHRGGDRSCRCWWGATSAPWPCSSGWSKPGC